MAVVKVENVGEDDGYVPGAMDGSNCAKKAWERDVTTIEPSTDHVCKAR